MKNIINWTLGGFFRSIGRILSFIVIGGLIAFLIAKSGLNVPDWLKPLYIVNAATLTPSSTQFDARYSSFNCSVSGHNCVLTDGGSWVGTTNMGSAITAPTGQTYNQLSLKYYYSSNFVAGNTYVFKIRINTTYPDFDNINKFVLLNVRGGNSTSELDNGNIQSSALISKSADTENDKVYYMTFSITPLVNIKYIWIYVGYKPINQVFKNGLSSGNIVVKNSGVSYSEGIGSQIDQQTQTIENQTIIIENEFNDLSNTITENNQNLINSITENNTTCFDLLITNSVNGINGVRLTNNGSESSSSSYMISNYYDINSSTTIKIKRATNNYFCFYNENKVVISCIQANSSNLDTLVTIPSNSKFVRFTLGTGASGRFTNYEYHSCNNSNQTIYDTLTDTNTDTESNSIYEELSNFNLSIEGPLTTIIRIPIDLLNTLLVDYNSSQTHADLCTTFVGKQICLPSGDIVWKRTGCHDNAPFGCPDYNAFRTFFQLVAGGAITYTLLRRLVKTIEKGLDPSSSRVDLMRL